MVGVGCVKNVLVEKLRTGDCAGRTLYSRQLRWRNYLYEKSQIMLVTSNLFAVDVCLTQASLTKKWNE
jgi:hypothetical protein